MFGFFQKLFDKSVPSGERELLPGGIDFHCHILPGVDDGFQDPEKSLEQLRIYEESGMKEVWFTPHIMEDVPNETADLRRIFEDFKEKYLQDFAQRHPGYQQKERSNLLRLMQSRCDCIWLPRTCWMPFSSDA